MKKVGSSLRTYCWGAFGVSFPSRPVIAVSSVRAIQLSVGTGEVVSRTTRSEDGLNRFLSQSAAGIADTGASAAAEAAADATFASNDCRLWGSIALSRATASGCKYGRTHWCGWKRRLMWETTCGAFIGWLNRMAIIT